MLKLRRIPSTIYLGLAKVIAMTGLVSLRSPTDATWLIPDFLGSRRFSPRNLAGFSLMQVCGP